MLLIPFLLLSMWASSNVQRVFARYSKIANSRMMTGAQAAEAISRRNGLNVAVERAQGGMLSDHYDPRTRTIRLSAEVYDSHSIAAVSVAAHEMGHALQHAQGYQALALRNSVFPVVSISSMAWMWLFLLGIILRNDMFITIGIALFGFVVLFQLITLPVEFNASTRAIAQMTDNGIIGSDEVPGAKKVLRAAAFTYIAAALASIANLVRLLLLRRRD